ncbi:MAG: polymer-forming cytoskeletal protein [Myxococcales bacterium]|nr:polymer-forming cytoskeletal protein [Myxococcales bacterium]
MKDQHSVISDGIRVSGTIEAAEDLLIRGRVDGDISSSQTVLIDVSGIVKGTLRAQTVIVRGVMVGDVHTKTITQLANEGRMVGNIYSPQVVLDEGAAFRGRIDMGEKVGEESPSRDERNNRFGSSGRGSSNREKQASPWGAPSPSKPAEREPAADTKESTVVAIKEDAPAEAEAREKKKAKS